MCCQWLKWFCEARGGAHLTKPGWNKPHTHSNPTNLALFRRKIALYRFNQGAHTIAQMGAGGLSPPEPPHFNYCVLHHVYHWLLADSCISPAVVWYRYLMKIKMKCNIYIRTSFFSCRIKIHNRYINPSDILSSLFLNHLYSEYCTEHCWRESDQSSMQVAGACKTSLVLTHATVKMRFISRRSGRFFVVLLPTVLCIPTH